MAATPGAYGPVQPVSWTDKLQAAVTAPFRTAPKPPVEQISPTDPLLLSKGAGAATPELFISLAGMSERTGDITQARQLYHEALRLDSKSSEAMLGMARLEDRQNRLDDALQWYQQAAYAKPDDAAVANDYGLCLARAGRMEEALTPLAQAARLEPLKPLYRNNIAKVLVALDRPAEAAQQLAAVHSPATVNFNMAVLLIDQGRMAEAARCLQLATTLDPQLTAANDLLAEMTAPEEEESQLVATPGDAQYLAQRPGADPLTAAITAAEQEAQPWSAKPAASDDSVLPTPPGDPALAPQDHFSEPVLLPAVD